MGALLLADGLDAWNNDLTTTAQSTFRFQPTFWAAVASNLIFAAALVLLTWFMRRRENGHPGLAIACLILGLLGLLSPITLFTESARELLSFLRSRTWLNLVSVFYRAGLGSRAALTPNILVVLGLAALLQGKTQQPAWPASGSLHSPDPPEGIMPANRLSVSIVQPRKIDPLNPDHGVQRVANGHWRLPWNSQPDRPGVPQEPRDETGLFQPDYKRA